MAIASYALTTVSRVKARLEIASGTTTWDALLAELINGATDIIEQYVGRRLASATYTNQIYSMRQGQRLLFLKAFPVTAISSFQYRIGTPDVPAWTDFLASEYYLDENGENGAIKIYFSLGGTNAVRITYTAGYTINFSTGHTLPYSISDICERLVVHMFKKRTDEGKSNDTAAEASVTWKSDYLSDMDKKTLDNFMRPVFT